MLYITADSLTKSASGRKKKKRCLSKDKTNLQPIIPVSLDDAQRIYPQISDLFTQSTCEVNRILKSPRKGTDFDVASKELIDIIIGKCREFCFTPTMTERHIESIFPSFISVLEESFCRY